MRKKNHGWARVLSLLLALAMLLSLTPAYAAELPVASCGGTEYTSLEAALGAAQSGDTVVLLRDCTLSQNAEVKSGVTLLAPYAADKTSVNSASATHPYANSESTAANSDTFTPAGESVTMTLSLAENVTLRVGSGAKLVVGGIFSSSGGGSKAGYGGQTCGAHSEIALGANSRILLDGGILSCAGYITGAGGIEASNSAKLYAPFVVCEYRGGSYTAVSTETNKTTPFNAYSMPNLQCAVNISTGSELNGYCNLYAREAHNTTTACIIGYSEAILRLSSGASAQISYDAGTAASIKPYIGRTTLRVSGGAEAGALSMKINVGFSTTVSTQNVFFPVPYNYNIILADGEYIIPYKLKLLPGASLTVERGATLTVPSGGSLAVYDGYTGGAFVPYPTNAMLAAARLSERGELIVNGTLMVADGGSFCGTVQSESFGRVSLGSGAVLSSTLKEGVIKDQSFLVMIKAPATDQTERTLYAEAYGDNGAFRLEAGKTYGGAPAQTVLKAGEAGYGFTSWGSDGTTSENVTVKYAADQTVDGKWYLPLALSADGESLGALFPGESLPLTQPAPRVGHSFIGWFDGDNQYAAGDAMPSHALALTSEWSANSYTLTFDSNGGGEVGPITQDYGTAVTPPQAPERVGYTFAGWDKALPKTMPAEDMSFTAQWTANEYTLSFDTNGGDALTDMSVTYGLPYGSLPVPRRVGYDFGGWYDADGAVITKDSLVERPSDHTLSAVWTESRDTAYTIRHIAQTLGGEYTLELGRETLHGVTNASATAAPGEFEGFSFSAEKSAASQSGTIAADGSLELLLYYNRNNYSIDFYDGKTVVRTQRALYGETLSAPDYARDGYSFGGWYSDEACAEKYEFTVMPAHNLTLYAKLTALPFTVSFDTNGGSTVESITAPCGSPLTAPPPPEKAGHSFTGWYSDEACTEKYEFTTVPARDLTLYAGWTINSYDVTFRSVDEYGAVIRGDITDTVLYLESAAIPDAPAGYAFTGADGSAEAVCEDMLITLSYESYSGKLDRFVSSDEFDAADGADVKTAESYYEKMTAAQREDYRAAESCESFIAAVREYESAALEADIAQNRIGPTNAILADPGRYVSDAGEGAVAVLSLPDTRKVYVDFLRSDFLAANMLDIPFLTELFGSGSITGVSIDGQNVDINAENAQFQLMLAVATAALEVPEGYSDIRDYLIANQATLPISVLDGKSVTATVTGTVLGDISFDVVYELHFFNHSHSLSIEYLLPDGSSAAADTVVTLGYGDEYSFEAPAVTGYAPDKTLVSGTMGTADRAETVRYSAKEYTLTFDSDGGEPVGSKTVTYGSPCGELPVPVREGYDFVGWYDADGERVLDSTVYTSDGASTLTARWSVNAFSVTYTVDGQTVKTDTYDYGAAITPYVFTKTGYTVSPWSPALPKTMPAENLSVSAVTSVNSYTVSYVVNGGTVHTDTLRYGEAIPEYTYSREGYTFSGWDKTPPETMPAENLVLSGTAAVNSYTVSFTVDGETVTSRKVAYGAEIPLPTYEKTGYTFGGWQNVPETMPARDIVIEGALTPNSYTLSFDANGGSEVYPITQDYGTAVAPPQAPVREGYTFAGWDKPLPETIPAEDMSFTAQWTANTYTLSFNSNGGGKVDGMSVTYGSPCGELPVPEREGYTFAGWTLDDKLITAQTVYNLSADSTLTAQWTPRGDTPYTVEHYLAALDGGYELSLSEKLSSATGASVSAVKRSYEGFAFSEAASTASGTVAADGSLVLKMYYDRLSYTVTWSVNGTETSQSCLYGETPVFDGSTERAGDDTHEFIFTGWSPEPAAVTGDVTYTAQYREFYEAYIGDRTYLRLSDALKAAESGDTVVLHEDAELAEDALVPAGVMLLVPCRDNDTGYDPATGYCPDGVSADGTSGVGPDAFCYRTLTVGAGAVLTVEGTVLVNAVVGRPKTGCYEHDVTGGYGVIDLEGGIVVKNGALLDVCGYLGGGGSVEAESGATVYDLYVVRNWRGGNQALACVRKGVYPMNEYDCRNITARLVIRSGATFSGTVKMYADPRPLFPDEPGPRFYYTHFPQIDNQNGLIRLSGADSYAVRTVENGREVYSLYGGAEFSHSKLEILPGTRVNSADFVFPIDGDISFSLNDGGYVFSDDYKLLTGAQMSAENAEISVAEGKTLVLYDRYDAAEVVGSRYPDRPAATLTLGDKAGMKLVGSFAGTVYASDGVGAITKADCTALSVTAREDAGGNEVQSFEVGARFIREGCAPRWVDNTLVWTTGDFSAVDAAIADAPGDLSIYSDESAAALRLAIKAVDYTESDAAKIAGYAEAIRAATDALVYRSYTISWDVNGSVSTTQVRYGDMPVYGGTPSRESDAQYSYGFAGWSPELSAADGDAVYTAQFTPTLRRYTVKFVSDGAAVQSDTLDYGGTVTAPGLPDPENGLFEGWALSEGAQKADCAAGDTVTVRGDMTFFPVWHTHSYDAAVTLPTEERGGYTTYTCACGSSYTGDETGPLPDITGRFDDVSHDWSYQGIAWCVDRGLMDGVGGRRFEPNGSTTRAMVVTVLWRQAGCPEPDGESGFTDLSADWYRDAVAWAAENGVVTGRTAEIFDPNAPIQRQEMSAILYRFADKVLHADVSAAVSLDKFPDAGSVASYARRTMSWAVAEGLILGSRENGADLLLPSGAATRAQTATILMRFCAAYPAR